MPYHLATAHHLRTPVTIQSERIALPLMKKEKKRREMTGCVFEDTQHKRKLIFIINPTNLKIQRTFLLYIKNFF